MRKAIFYLIYLTVLLTYILESYKFLNQVRADAQEMFNMQRFYIFSVCLYILFGLLLALDYIVRQIENKGSWQINIAKLLFVGLPALISVILIIIQLYIPVNLPRVFRTKEFMMFIPIILGYTAGTLFYRRETKIEG